MKILEKYQIELATVVVFIIYLQTLAPGIVQIDSGELAAVVSTAGIAHPTGYPLFTILGYLLTHLLFFVPKIYAANLFSALCTTFGIFFLIKFNIALFQNFTFQKIIKSTKHIKKKVKEIKTSKVLEKVDNSIIIYSSLITGISIAFFKTIWDQSTSIEVYSLHILLISATLFFFVKSIYNEDYKNLPFIKQKYFIVFAFFLGLAFTNHLTTILLIPGIAYFYFVQFGFNKSSFMRILKMQIPFFAALSFYLYLPIRAASDPLINWGNPINFENFKRHFMAWQYQSWIFSSTEAASKQFNYFFNNLADQLGYIGLILSIIGLIFLFIKNKKIFLFISISFVSCLLYAINYDIKDIDSYFILAYISLGIFITPICIYIIKYFQENNFNKYLRYILFLIPIFILINNYEKVDSSENVQIHEYSEAVLNSFEKDAFVLSYMWDFFVAPTYYYQFVEKKRMDLIILDKELVRRSWYFNQIKRLDTKFYKKIEHLVSPFLVELAKFERGQKYDGNLLDSYYKRILSEMIVKNINDRPVYIGPEILSNEISSGQLVLPDSISFVPHTYFYKAVIKSNSYYDCPLPTSKINISSKEDYYTETIRNLLSGSAMARAMYEKSFEKLDRAKLFVKKAKEINPMVTIPSELNF